MSSGSSAVAFQFLATKLTHYYDLGYAEDAYAEGPYTAADMAAAEAMQFLALTYSSTAMQFLAQIYNTDNLRILSEFPSRGVSGNNWVASSTQAGDFNVLNLNTDVEEQVWRSATGHLTSLILIADTQVTQGILIDTIAIRNHNLTTSAALTIEASNDPFFGTIGLTIHPTILPTHIYWISPDAPINQYRYFRFTIDDPTNTAGFVSIGTVLFGLSHILQGESFIDQVGFSYKDYADTVETEGFTSVANSRALKKQLSLSFRSLQFPLANFQLLRTIYTKYRTTYKLLVIPTPDPVDMTTVARFAVFAKLTKVPDETHNWKGSNADYVAFDISLDEGK